MKKILILLLCTFPGLLLSQTAPPECTIYQIDSLANVYGNSLHDVAGKLTVQKRTIFGKRTVANGGFTSSMYFSVPANYRNFTPEERKLKANGPKLIKAVYFESLSFKDGHNTELIGEFYYCNDALYTVRLSKKTVSKKGTLEEISYIIDVNGKLSTDVADAFTFNVQNWIDEKNEEFLKLALQ